LAVKKKTATKTPQAQSSSVTEVTRPSTGFVVCTTDSRGLEKSKFRV